MRSAANCDPAFRHVHKSLVDSGHLATSGYTIFGMRQFNGGNSDARMMTMFNWPIKFNSTCAVIAITIASGTFAADEQPKSAIEVQSVALRLLEEAEVPAQEAGVITSVAVREGQRVKQGELLTQIDDQVPKLVADATKAKYDIARAKAMNDVRLRFAHKSTEV